MAFSGHRCTNVYFLCGCIIKIRNFAPAIKNQLNNNGIDVETPNLFSIVKNYQVNYDNMYKTFADYCNGFNEKINLVGLSLGGVLAIDYITEFPEK